MDNLFETNNETVQVDENQDYFALLTGPDGKFHDPDAEKAKQKVAKGKYEADLTIEMLKRQKDELRNDFLALREEHAAGAKLKDLIDQLAVAKQQQLASNEPTIVNEDKKPFDVDQLDSILDKKMEERESSRIRAQNAQKVVDKLQETLGSDYVNVLQKKANSMGLSMDDVKELARKSPDAFYNTFGLNQAREGFQSPPGSTVRTDSFSQGGKKRTWDYYQQMKKTDPKRYSSIQTHNAMIEDYKTLGSAFEDGNFHQLSR